MPSPSTVAPVLSTLSAQEALAAFGLAAVAGDEAITNEERDYLLFSLAGKRLYIGYDAHQLASLVTEVAGLLAQQGFTNTLQAASAAMSPDLRLTAFALVADILTADGSLDERRRRFAEYFRRLLRVRHEVSASVLDVMLAKNGG